MDKILEALSKLLPEDQMKDVTVAVQEMVEEIKADLETEYNKNLEEAYATLSEELQQSEKTGEEGYREAWDIITDLRNRLEMQRTEYDAALDEGYEEAYQQILAERGKNESLETQLYEEYERRFAEAKTYTIDKIDQFLRNKGKEIYDIARRDIMNDPNMVEHKLVLDKIVESVSDYISDEDRVLATSTKLEDARKQLEEVQGRVRMLEAKNIRLSTENNKLNEQVKQAADLVTESKKVADDESKKARVEKAKNVTGRGNVTTEKVIAEYAAEQPAKAEDVDTALVEEFNPAMLEQMKALAGMNK